MLVQSHEAGGQQAGDGRTTFLIREWGARHWWSVNGEIGGSMEASGNLHLPLQLTTHDLCRLTKLCDTLGTDS